MKINFNNKTVGGFNYEFVRTISTQAVGAAEFGECMDTMGRIKDGDFESWIHEWSATADRAAYFADQALERGDAVSARTAYLKASNYYRTAVFYAYYTDPRHAALWKAGKDCFKKMIPLAEHTIEPVSIDFESAKLPGYFISAGVGARPTLIAIGGFDSTIEEVYSWIGGVAVAWGWHCLIFSGPGQWDALAMNPGLVFIPDYEKPMTAAVDYLYTRKDVDKDKVALIGYSAGGYYAPRAASGEPRIKACIANTLVVDCGESARAGLKGLSNPWLIDTMFNFLMKFSTSARWGFQHSQWSLGIKTPHEWVDVYAPFTIKGREENFKNPMLFLFSEDDIIDAAAPSKKIVEGLLDFIQRLPCDRYMHLFGRREGASGHCQMGGLSYAHAVIFPWLEHIFNGKKLYHEPDAPAHNALVEIFRKYGGNVAGEKALRLLGSIQLV